MYHEYCNGKHHTHKQVQMAVKCLCKTWDSIYRYIESQIKQGILYIVILPYHVPSIHLVLVLSNWLNQLTYATFWVSKWSLNQLPEASVKWKLPYLHIIKNHRKGMTIDIWPPKKLLDFTLVIELTTSQTWNHTIWSSYTRQGLTNHSVLPTWGSICWNVFVVLEI